MSKLKIKNLFIFSLLALVTVFAFGCDATTSVESVYFDLAPEEQIIMTVDQTIDLSELVVVTPSYATNKNYKITSLDTSVVTVKNNEITALKKGSTLIRVVSKADNRKEDLVIVKVEENVTNLEKPTNFRYDAEKQTVTFDLVNNASTYTLKVGENEYDLKNNNVINLANYFNDVYDNILNMSIKANPSKYSYAYESSEYENYSVYQSAPIRNITIVGGEMVFDRVENSMYNIYLDGELYKSKITDNTLSLLSLPDTYAGDSVEISVVVMLEQDEIDNLNVDSYNNSPKCTKLINVLGTTEPKVVSNILTWNDVEYSTGYKVYINDVNVLNKKTILEDIDNTSGVCINNRLDLSTLENLDEFISVNKVSEVVVSPILSDDALDLAKTNKKTKISLSRLSSPNIRLANGGIEWDKIDNAEVYTFYMKVGETIINTSKVGNSFSLLNYPSNSDFEIKISALPKVSTGDVYYISSKEVSKSIHKQSIPNVEIDNYYLNIESIEGDTYLVESDTLSLSEEIVADSDNIAFDLLDISISAGEHNIVVTHLGDNEDTLDSSTSNVSFLQYKKIENIDITNGIASVVVDEVNTTATIELVTNIGENKHKVAASTYTYNTLDKSKDDYLSSGVYTTYVYVLGDGVNTFSYGVERGSNGITTSPSASTNVTVLGIPSFSTYDKTKSEINFTSIENASGYNVNDTGVVKSISNTTYSLSIGGDTKTIKVQAVGDGIEYLNSNWSEMISVKKLSTPTLVFDNANNKIYIEDDNIDLLGYRFVGNDIDEIVDINYTYNESNLNVGVNDFTLTAVAKDVVGNNYYINSDTSRLLVEKIDDTSTIEIKNNKLVISTSVSHTREFDLKVKFDFAGEEKVFISNGRTLECNGESSLNYIYDEINHRYIVTLLDEYYNVLIDKMKSDFDVSVKYTVESTGNDYYADSDYSNEATLRLNVLTSPVLARSGQNITFYNVKNTYDISNYSLIINDNVEVQLSDCEAVDGVYTLSINTIFDIVDNYADIYEVNDIQILVSGNTVDAESISARSNKLYIQKHKTVTLTTTKDNNATDNSRFVLFDIINSGYDYEFSYDVVVSDKENNIPITFKNQNANNGKISIRLDDSAYAGLSNNITVVAKVTTNDNYILDDKVVELFNSNVSNTISTAKLSAVSNIYTQDNTIHFGLVEGAIGYEIYQDGTKHNNALLTTNSYDFVGSVGQHVFTIKAISDVVLDTNSNHSDVITVYKLNKPTISVVGGDIVLTISDVAKALIDTEGVDISIVCMIGENEVIINLKSLDKEIATIEGNNITIKAEKLLTYKYASIQAEEISFKIKINYTKLDNSIYYLSSDVISDSFYGLFAPTNVKKIADNEYVNYITWTASDKNVLKITNETDITLSVGYIFKIEYTDSDGNSGIYYSNDENLLYEDGGNYYPYTLSSATQLKFPYKYLGEDGEILFSDGVYRVSVQTTIMTTVGGYNICNSKFSEYIEFEILPTLTLSSSAGIIKWDELVNASYYAITVTQGDLVVNDVSYTNSYDFSHNDLASVAGLCNVTVKAISNSADVLNGQESEALTIYRLPVASEVVIDDGDIVVTADSYITKIQVIVIDTTTNKVYTPKAHDTSAVAQKNFKTLNIKSWDKLTDDGHYNLSETMRYLIPIDELDLLDGREYNIEIKLLGESENLGDYSSLGLVNSIVSEKFDLTVSKLKMCEYNVEKGEIKYNMTSTYNDISFNYNFTNSDSINEFWNSVFIYVINLTTPTDKHVIYAVDYDQFITSISGNNPILATDKYEIKEKNGLYAVVKYFDGENTLYFNVYEENKINLAIYDELYYYATTKVVEYGEISYTNVGETEINMANGGAFLVNIGVLGGDQYAYKKKDVDGQISDSYIGYVNSNDNELKPFMRYGENYLSSTKGLIKYNDMVTLKDNVAIDYPVYRLKISPVNSTSDSETMIIYHYVYDDTNPKMTEETAYSVAESIAKRNDNTWWGNGQITIVLSKYSAVSDYITLDLAKYLDAKYVYNVNIRTLAGIGSGESDEINYLLNAKETDKAPSFFKFSDTSFTINSNGLLEFSESYITRDSVNVYAKSYEIKITDLDTDKVEIIEISVVDGSLSDGVVVDTVNHKVRYTLSNEFVGTRYSISVHAMTDENYMLNGTYSDSFEFGKSALPQGVSISNGILTWKITDLENYSKTFIKLSYTDEFDEIHEIVFDEIGTPVYDGTDYLYHTYTFLDTQYDMGGVKVYIDANIPYKLSLMVVGRASANIVNSGYTEAKDVTRLESVYTDSIVTNDTILDWTDVGGAVGYLVTFVDSDDVEYTYITETSEIDFTKNVAILNAGEYSIRIKALGDKQINAKDTVAKTGFIKLSTVDGISINDEYQLSWNSVNNATHYEITFVYTNTKGESMEYVDVVDTNEINAPNDIVGKFTAYVRALAKIDDEFDGMILSGEAKSYTSINDVPTQVGEILFDDQYFAYYWTVSDDFVESDVMVIRYHLAELTSQNTSNTSIEVEVRIEYEESGYYYVSGNNKYYYYTLDKIGTYTDFSVQVLRPNNVPSSASMGKDQEYKIYAYGEGSETNPYRISTISHLLNINYFATRDKYFEMINSIYIGDDVVDYATLLDEHYDESSGYTGVISAEFNGVFDGKNYNLFADEISLNNELSFALFGYLDGATIKNLKFGKENQMTLLNSFANSTQNVVQLSLIATGANNSRIENVDILNVKIVLSATKSDVQLKGDIYIGGIINDDYASTIYAANQSTLNTSLTVDVQLDFTEDVWVGSVISKSQESNVEGYKSSLTLSVSKNNRLCRYVGGIIGQYIGNTKLNTGIKNSEGSVAVDGVNVAYLGAIVGHAKYISIEKCVAHGNISHTSLGANTYIGGIVGYATSVKVIDSKSIVTFDVEISVVNNQCIGAIVGYINADNNVSSLIDDCGVSNGVILGITVIDSNGIKIGTHGQTGSGVTISNSYNY